MSCVPYVPSQLEVVRKVLEIARVKHRDVVCDLSCGDGRILTMAVKDFGAKRDKGYEINNEIFKEALRRIELQDLQDKIELINGDLFAADISEAAVITLCLTTSGNERLKSKLIKETRPHTALTHDFSMNDWLVSIKESFGYGRTVYPYVIPDAFSQKKLGSTCF